MNEKRKPMILIVDDEPAYRRFLRKVMDTFFNVDIIEAANPKEGFEILKEQSPDLIFLDMQMPIMDGLTMLKHLRMVPKTNQIPVIACTALASIDLLAQLVKLKIVDYVVKPITVPQLVEKLSMVFAKINISDVAKRQDK